MPSGTQWANVLHFRYAAGASSPGPTEIAALDAIVRRLYTGTAYTGGGAYLTLCRPTVSLIDMTAYVLNGTSTPVLININAVGSDASNNQQAQEVANVLTLRTALRGRSYRGRVYLPALGYQRTDAAGNLLTATTTLVTQQAVGIQAALAGIQWSWVVASYKHSTAQDVTSFTMDSRPDVQRRRKR